MTAGDAAWLMTLAAIAITGVAFFIAVVTRHELAAADCAPVMAFMAFYAGQVADFGGDDEPEEADDDT